MSQKLEKNPGPFFTALVDGVTGFFLKFQQNMIPI